MLGTLTISARKEKPGVSQRYYTTAISALVLKHNRPATTTYVVVVVRRREKNPPSPPGTFEQIPAPVMNAAAAM
ncbi:unnamed protein product [Boreogadus saida]